MGTKCKKQFLNIYHHKCWRNELTITSLVLLVSFVIILYFDLQYSIKPTDILVEANGYLLDLFVFGVLILFFNKLIEKRRIKQHYHEEIDDYRDWIAEGSKFRIIGNIKRLAKLGETCLDLNRCYLAISPDCYTNAQLRLDA